MTSWHAWSSHPSGLVGRRAEIYQTEGVAQAILMALIVPKGRRLRFTSSDGARHNYILEFHIANRRLFPRTRGRKTRQIGGAEVLRVRVGHSEETMLLEDGRLYFLEGGSRVVLYPA